MVGEGLEESQHSTARQVPYLRSVQDLSQVETELFRQEWKSYFSWEGRLGVVSPPYLWIRTHGKGGLTIPHHFI